MSSYPSPFTPYPLEFLHRLHPRQTIPCPPQRRHLPRHERGSDLPVSSPHRSKGPTQPRNSPIWTIQLSALSSDRATDSVRESVPTATFEELWRGRRPDFRARNEKRNLTRQGIDVEFVMKDANSITVQALAKNILHIRYLANRGYEKVPEKVEPKHFSDVVQTILARPRTGPGGGIPLTRGEVATLFLDGYAGDHPDLLDIRSQGYGDDNLWDGLAPDDILEDENTAFVWQKWEPLELWFQ